MIKYKDSELGLNELGNKLDVNYVLAGNIMKMGDNFRLSLQFYDVLAKSDLWLETWEGNMMLFKTLRVKYYIKC